MMAKTMLGSCLKTGSRCSSLADIGDRLEARMGKIPFSGRYHREPRRLEDDYVVSQSVLGSGYNGQVREATSVSRPGEKFAVKSLKLGGSSESRLEKQEKLEHLQAEVENYLSIDHPHVARLYDVYESKEELHMVMECMEGGELFDRVQGKKNKRFSEAEASDVLRQMLLALNYIHSHGIVHRDVKLENFIYDRKYSCHVKLIDFGFSKMVDPNGHETMKDSLGTLSYVAPEVLQLNYTSQCDMWSLGVCGFIMLGGYMPFAGEDNVMRECISTGKYTMRRDRWSKISSKATDFIKSLLEVNPAKRLTAQQALQHPWIAQGREGKCEDAVMYSALKPYCESLQCFSRASKFRRCCYEMLAWSLSNEDRAKVRNSFLSMDANQQGTITLHDLQHIMVDKLRLVDEQEVLKVFQALDYNHDQEIHYSDFLAAMVDTQIDVKDNILTDTFRRFDIDGSGFITAENLRDVLGRKVDGESMEAFIAEADQSKDGRLCFKEFAAYLRGTRLDDIAVFTAVDDGVAQQPCPTTASKPRRSSGLTSMLKGFKAHLRCFSVAARMAPASTA